MDIDNAFAYELVEALRDRRLEATELLEATFERADAIAPAFNPFARTLRERARRRARRADEALAQGAGGPLCGLPITIKDSHWLARFPCANGSRTLADFVPTKTSEAVRRLEAAGAVLFAKTTCPEFSLVGITDSPLYGLTRNPRHLDRTPGGSSGGAAAAVAAGLGTLALGGDGGGSIRIPAAFCGVVGFKPTHGAVPRAPCFDGWESLVSYGPLARSVVDAALMFDVLTGTEQATELAGEVGGLHLIVSPDLGFAPLDADVRHRFEETVERLGHAGAHLVFDHPHLRSSAETWSVVAYHDSARGHANADAEKELGDATRDILAFGAHFTDGDRARAEDRRRAIGAAYGRLFERAGTGLLVTPALGCEAFGHGRLWPERIGETDIGPPWADWVGLLYDANLAGMPACVLPMGLGDEGLPLALQVMGPPGADREVLAAAAAIERLLDWRHEHLDARLNNGAQTVKPPHL